MLADALLSVPAVPVPLLHVLAPQVTSLAVHVAAPPTGGVNDAVSAWSEIRSCRVADDSTMLVTVIEAALDAVLLATSFTMKLAVEGKVTRACSLTVAVNVVVWLVSGSVSVV
jgi:hypothetical protein